MKSKSQNVFTEKSKSQKNICRSKMISKEHGKAKRQVRPLHEYRKANLKQRKD